jgi:hypothetical protein
MVRNVKANPTASLRFQAHLAFPQCLPSTLKCQKSLQARPTRTQGQKDSAAKIKDRLTNDKNGQLVTRYIKNWADTSEIKGCSSLQAFYRFDSDMLRSAQLFICVPRNCTSALNSTVYFNRDGGIDPPKSFYRRGLQTT